VDHIGVVIISAFATSVQDCRFEQRSGQTKDCRIGICCFSTQHIKELEQRLVDLESG
jgi:hypothetical protein